MFRSAAKDTSRPTPQRISATSYESFQELTNQEKDGKRKHISSSDSDDDIIVDKVEKRSHKKKKHKRDKKKHKKSEHKSSSKKKHRRNSKSSDDSCVIVCSSSDTPSSSTNDYFMDYRKPMLDNYNYKFERSLKGRPLHVESFLTLTLNRDSFALKELFYGEDGKSKPKSRYYTWENREPFQKVANERSYRSSGGETFLTEDGMRVSMTPYDPLDDPNCIQQEDFVHTYDDEDEILAKSYKFTDYPNLTIKKRRKNIQNAIKFEESDVGNWLKFLKVEDEEFESLSKVGKYSSTVVNRISFLERRLAIVERGLEKVGRDRSLKLHLEKLRIMTELYGYFDNRVTDHWKKLQNIYLNSLELWQAFIQQLLHNSNEFKLGKVLEQYDNALQRLVGLYVQTISSHKVMPGTDKFLIELVVSRTRLLLEAGHVHVVVAILQAVAEYYFFAPDDIESKNWTERLRAFHEFWYSAAPRLGDKFSKGWKNSNYVTGFQESLEFEQNYEKELSDTVDTLESGLIKKLQMLDGATRLYAWSELERIRSKHCWKPIGRFSKLVCPDTLEANKRLVKFDNIKSSLLPFKDKKLRLELMLRLLQLVGVIVPRMEDNSQFGLLHSILPNDFNFLRQTFKDMDSFLTEFLITLSTSSEIEEIEKVLASVVLTRTMFLELEDADQSTKLHEINELRTRIHGLDISKEAMYCTSIYINNVCFDFLEVQKCLTGLNLKDVFDGSDQSIKKKLVGSIVAMLGGGDPCSYSDGQQKQILLRSAFMLATLLPSEHAGLTFSRLRFLTLLVVGKLSEFFNEDYDVSSDMQLAQGLWTAHMDSAVERLASRSSTAKLYSFMESSDELIFMMRSLFEFDYTRISPFLDQQESVNRCIENSLALMSFRLDVGYELFKSCEIDWSTYLKWTMETVERYPDVSCFYRHLTNVIGAKPCQFRYFVEWKLMESDKKRRYAFSMFAAEYLKFKQACEADDPLLVDLVFKRIRRILEEAALLVSDTVQPDSFIWRLWHYIERHNRKSNLDVEKVYTLGVRNCPFAKNLLIDASLSSFIDSKLEEITNLANKFELNTFALLDEAKIVLEHAVKSANG